MKLRQPELFFTLLTLWKSALDWLVDWWNKVKHVFRTLEFNVIQVLMPNYLINSSLPLFTVAWFSLDSCWKIDSFKEEGKRNLYKDDIVSGHSCNLVKILHGVHLNCWFRRQILTIVITDFRSFFFLSSSSSTLNAFDPLWGNSRSWNSVSPNILAYLKEIWWRKNSLIL